MVGGTSPQAGSIRAQLAAVEAMEILLQPHQQLLHCQR